MAQVALSKLWEDAKASFQTVTGKKKPKESKGLLNAFGSHTGLSGSLAKFDEAEDKARKLSNMSKSDCDSGRKLEQEMDKQLAAFRRASASYIQVLDKAIVGDIDNRTEVDIKTTYERALKFLKRELQALEETGVSRVNSIRQRFDAGEKDLSVKQKMLLNWQKNMTAACARGSAAVAKVKANPDVKTYNSVFPTAARDITMQLVFAKDIPGLKADPEILLRAMNPWASQTGKPPASLPDNATPAQVKQFLSAFSAELKRAITLVATRG